jgi:hypothetical protein
MKASELREKLKELIEKHGDLEVYYVWNDVEEETAAHVEFKKTDIVNVEDGEDVVEDEIEPDAYPERFLIQ